MKVRTPVKYAERAAKKYVTCKKLNMSPQMTYMIRQNATLHWQQKEQWNWHKKLNMSKTFQSATYLETHVPNLIFY